MKNDHNIIDLVYLWVDGNDPAWRAKRNAFIGKAKEDPSVNCKGRTADNDELKYSLRSVEMHAPWVRKVFIVTDEQTPEWLDTSNSRVKIVDLKEILPPESLPCFNSCLIEHYLYRIPDLSEHFLYANDDMFINKEVKPKYFFTAEGFPIVRLFPKPFRRIRWFWREKIRRKMPNNYRKTLIRASQLVHAKFGIYYSGLPHHNIDSYLKSDCQRIVENVLHDECMANNKNHTRNDDDVQRIAFSYIALAEKRAQPHYVTKKESMRVLIHKKWWRNKLMKNNPMFFCMNDSEYANDSDRERLTAFLSQRFPEKSSFEK